jgi:hypothetical protein
MTIKFNRTIRKSLQEIHFDGPNYHDFIIHEHEEERCHHTSDEMMETYGDSKWAIVHLLNQRYGLLFENQVDLMNWVLDNKEDEVSYFLNEAGSNVLNYSEFKAPSKFHLWLGEKGFLIGVEQKGSGFDAKQIHDNGVKQNEGAAFKFFKSSKGTVFFNDPKQATIVYFEHSFL